MSGLQEAPGRQSGIGGRGVQRLPAADGRAVPAESVQGFGPGGPVRAAVDAVSAVSGERAL